MKQNETARLEDWQPVKNKTAFQLWRWGIPVKGGVRRGKDLLEAPKGPLPTNDGMPLHPAYAAPRILTLHLLFADGSNPYVKYCGCMQALKELEKWAGNYDIRRVDTKLSRVVTYELTEKNQASPLFPADDRNP